MNDRRPRGIDLLLYALLAATLVVPPLVVFPGFRDGQLAFTLYREPKLCAVQILGWTFVLLVLWRRRQAFTARAVGVVFRQPLLIALTAFFLYGAFTALWARVPENLFYELNQYFFILVFLVVLCAWSRQDGDVAPVVFYSLVFSLTPLTVVGLVQLVVEIPVLRSIDPGYGIRNASLMGYKNPMALALVGHFFLLLAVVWQSFQSQRRLWVKLALAGYALAELVYLVLLQSRTSYVALVVSSTVLAGVLLSAVRRARQLVAAALVGVVLAALVGLLVWTQPAVKVRFASVVEYLGDPQVFLDSDRGTYLRNTLNMVRYNPLGVGLGDWQTHYPVYRRYNRDLAFSDAFQVRRAHSDHVQFLGEVGYPGFALWLALLLAALLPPIRRFIRSGEASSLLVAVQLLAFVVAMATDYVVELPWHKFQFFLVGALAVMAGRVARPAASRERHYFVAGLALALTLAGAANVIYYVQLLAKSHHTAMLTATWLPAGRAGVARLRSVEQWGRRSESLAGHTKTYYKTYLLRAHVAFRQGEIPRAVELVRESLRLHPYHPNSFRLLSEILATTAPQEAVEYRKIHDHIMRTASEGFRIRYPAFFDRRRSRSPGSPSGPQRGAESAAARGEKGEDWDEFLGGRTVAAGGGHVVAVKLLHFCSDGRFYFETRDEGLAIDFGQWRVRPLGPGVVLELTSESGRVAISTLNMAGEVLLVDGKEVALRQENGICP